MTMAGADIRDLATAKELLENPGLAARISAFAGSPIERGIKRLPRNWLRVFEKAAQTAIEQALEAALWTLDCNEQGVSKDRRHKFMAAMTGAFGGAFGVAALSVELPASTTLILRSIADIARSEGEDLRLPEARLACLQVLALGGNSPKDDGADTGYFSARAALAGAVSDAARFVAEKGLAKGGPAMVRLITEISSRFSLTVTQKAAAQAIPVIGAAAGAAVNTIFITHFQNMARGHFVVRRLERRYGAELVRGTYRAL